MHTRVGQILRSLFWTFLIHTANVSSFEHAVALKVPYYQPYVSMIWLLSYFELNCTAWPSNWQVLCLYSTKKCSFSKHFRPAVMSAHVSRGACMQHYEHPWCSHFDGQCSNEVKHILAPLMHVSLTPKQTKWILTHAYPTYLPFLLVGRILLLTSSHDPRHLYGQGLCAYQKCKI